MTTFNQFSHIFKTIFRNNIKRSRWLGEKKGQKIAAFIGIGIGVMSIMLYLVLFTVFFTSAAIAAGLHEKLLYLFIGLSQLAVLFLGSIASMGYIYFSKDNHLLASLPIKPRAIFMAKLAMAYIAEFVIGAALMVPTVTAFGIVCLAHGIKLNALFFICEIIGVFILPVVPLLIISLVSLPLMRLMALIKKRTLSNAIAVAIILVLVLSVYFGLLGSFTDMAVQSAEEEGTVITAQMASMINNGYKIFIFNKPFVDAMLGKRAALNLAIYLCGIIALAALDIAISSFFYRKGIAVIIDGDGKRDARKVKKELVYTTAGLKYSLFRKELKTLANTPMMLVTSLMGVIMGPVLLFFMSKSGAFLISDDLARAQLYTVGFVSYFVSLMMGATNQIAMVGFSREGKNLLTLKALPLPAELLIKVKLFAATSANVVTLLLVAIVYLILIPGFPILQTLIIAAVTLSCAFGINCLGLYNDLKNPNLKWLNINELTRNNKRAIKPALTAAGVGISYLIMGTVLSNQKAIGTVWSYALFCGISALANTLLIIVGHKKLFENPQKLLDAVEE